MSKINSDFLKKTINELVTTRKQRKFQETVEFPDRTQRLRPRQKIQRRCQAAVPGLIQPQSIAPPTETCVLANAAHIEEANANSIAYIDVEGLKAFNKDKTKIKKWHLSFYHSIVIYCYGVSSAGICPS